MSKVRKVYNLRKTANIKLQSPLQPEESRVSQFREDPEHSFKETEAFQKNLSVLSVNYKQPQQSRIVEETAQYQVDEEELSINRLQLNFRVPVNDIDKKDVKIKNIGNSAVYVQLNFKNSAKINQNGFKDAKLKFYCHYENSVIKPGEESTFIFSFLSQFAGDFTEEVEISCKPPLRTVIPNLKLNGTSFIKDQWESNRRQFASGIDQIALKNQVKQILADIVSQVRLPPPSLPDVKDLKVAEIEFQNKNAGQGLFFNQYLHSWFNGLFDQICEKAGIAQTDRYWDQSADTLQTMIDKSKHLDQVDNKCFQDRLQHYCYLSMTPLATKSDLYQTVNQFVSSAAFALGGDYVDAAKKQLEMWDVPFREPLQTDTPEDLKARKDEADKIKADWVKKAKKKKWGEQEEKQMISQFKKKAQSKITENILNRFDNFEESAQFIKTRQFLKKSNFKLNEYHRYLQRIKTVRECPLDGKKVLIKWRLKLKDNCEQQLKQLDEYLTKKKQLDKRLEEEKKEGAKKKKTVVKLKKKGQKEQQEEKPLVFDFMSILDEENWNGFTQTFRVVMEKQPYLVLLGITYGPRAGRHLSQYSVQFMLEHLKALQSSIEFFPHEQLPTLKEKLETQIISEGSILLMENLNFLPYETCVEEVVQPAAEEGKQPTVTKRKLLQPQIRQFFDDLGSSIDVIVNEDRFLTQLSGFTAYLGKQVLMGTQWWKYVGISTRTIDSTIIFGGDFTPNAYLLFSRLAPVVRQIYLTGKAGLKFYLVQNNLQRLGNIVLGKSERQAIQSFKKNLVKTKDQQKLKIPVDFILKKVDQAELISFDGNQIEAPGCSVIDIGNKSIDQINSIMNGHLLVLGETAVQTSKLQLSDSLAKIIKVFFKKEEEKRERHAQQSSTPTGINYTEDLVIYLIGIDQALVEKVDFKERKAGKAGKARTSEEEEEEQAGEEQEQEGENDKKKIDLVSDFRLSSLGCLGRLWGGEFDLGLRDVDKYQLIWED